MPSIDQLKPEQLRYPDIFEKIKELANSFILHVDAKESSLFLEKLTPLLKASDLENLQPELHKKYQDLIAQLKWVALPLLSDEETMKTLQECYLMFLENEYINATDRIEAKMFSVDLFPRNEIRQEMQKALKENKERLGDKTFGEWLLDYSKTFDFRDRDELAPSRYISQSPEAQALNEQEKNKLRKAFQIFDKNLLVTPVMSEPAFSMTVREMIKAGTIKEQVNPVLLQLPTRVITAPEKTPAKVAEKIEKPKTSLYGKKISPQEELYQIRTMKQDVEKAKKKPIPPKPKPKIKDNIVDLSGK